MNLSYIFYRKKVKNPFGWLLYYKNTTNRIRFIIYIHIYIYNTHSLVISVKYIYIYIGVTLLLASPGDTIARNATEDIYISN